MASLPSPSFVFTWNGSTLKLHTKWAYPGIKKSAHKPHLRLLRFTVCRKQSLVGPVGESVFTARLRLEECIHLTGWQRLPSLDLSLGSLPLQATGDNIRQSKHYVRWTKEDKFASSFSFLAPFQSSQWPFLMQYLLYVTHHGPLCPREAWSILTETLLGFFKESFHLYHDVTL